MLLAGDIGGTKTRLALFSNEKGPRNPLIKETFRSDEYTSFTDIVIEFIRRNKAQPELSSFGVAGPVHGPRVKVTNLAWEVDAPKLSQALDDTPVHLINDLHALASAIPVLTSSDLETLKPGTIAEHGPIAVVAPGTGLGEAFLFWDGQRYRPMPSEGGHTDFAPATSLELELLSFLQPRLGHVSYERVCSGIGIPNLYRFLKETEKYQEPEWLEEKLQTASDMTPIIVEAARSEKVEICVATLDLFMAILGSEAGNLVLQILATGGVYLGGGIPPRIIADLKGGAFQNAFTRKGRFSDLLNSVAVKVIINPKAGLYGAANHGLLLAEQSIG